MRDELFWEEFARYLQEKGEPKGFGVSPDNTMDFEGATESASQQTSKFTDEYWLPIKVYELTSKRTVRVEAFDGSGPP